MKTKLILRVIFFILTIATCIMIFLFSAEDGNKSKKTSGNTMRAIVNTYPPTKKLSEKEKDKIVEDKQPIVRKIAHFTEYAILGISLMGLLCTYDLEWKKACLIAMSFIIVYAITDEIHQGFTGGGRTPKILDILVDIVGGSLGLIINITINKIFWQKKSKKSKKTIAK